MFHAIPFHCNRPVGHIITYRRRIWNIFHKSPCGVFAELNFINTTLHIFCTEYQPFKHIYILLTLIFQVRAEFITTSFQVRSFCIFHHHFKHCQFVNIKYNKLRNIFCQIHLYTANTQSSCILYGMNLQHRCNMFFQCRLDKCVY